MRLWGGRFAEAPQERAAAYTASLAFDRRLWPYDLRGSMAHARMLARQGIISQTEGEALLKGLALIEEELRTGRFAFREELEDIHLNIEARLREIVGDVAGKLHTARSRNDQVALDMRLYLRDAIGETIAALHELQGALLDQAEAHLETLMPGYTHLQRAQPVLLAHHLLAYVEMFERDAARFRDALKRANVLPLGAGALAGVPYPVDQEWLAQELGFEGVAANSMDAVSDRDFVVEYEAAAALALVHVSRLAEELVLWSTAEFGFVELPEAFTTGSSIMPQKRNPDVAELARAKVGRVVGHLMAMLMVLKGLPLTYNRDLQEDKEGLFDTVDTLIETLRVLADMLRGARFNAERMRQALRAGYLTATDVADYLVGKGLPFREAHQAVGRLVRYAEERGKGLDELGLEEFRRFSPLFEEDVLRITAESAVAARRSIGGTAPDRVRSALQRARERWSKGAA